MERASFDLSRCVNALRGTEPAADEVVAALDEDEELLVAPTPELNAFAGDASTPADGVYAAEVVVAFEPADEDPDAAKEVEAPGPEAPAEVLVWIYRSWSRAGLV
jgi:hypothetical protein